MEEEVVFHGTLDLDEARELAQRVVARQGPDFRYCNGDTPVAMCLYVTRGYAQENWPMWNDSVAGHPETPCIVGAILDERGDTWHRAIRFRATTPKGIYDQEPERFTLAAAAYLTNMQYWQDNGNTWGDSVTYAETTFEEEIRTYQHFTRLMISFFVPIITFALTWVLVLCNTEPCTRINPGAGSNRSQGTVRR